MSSTRCSIADESHLCSRAARTPFQPVVSPDSDSEDIDDLDPVFETIPFRRSHHRQINQYISGGRGGRGGGAGVYGSGGAGGPGEGPILQYDIRAECLTMRTYMTTHTKPSDYLRLPLGSIDLRNEIRLYAAAGVVSRHDGRSLVRRMYSARVGCRRKPMTVALYHGDHAEEEWRKSVSIHSRLRHPHIIQLYATASSSGIHTAVYHDDLIHLRQFVDCFRHSAILQAYIYVYTIVDRLEAWQYYRSRSLDLHRMIFWIRRSTGRLCIELMTIGVEDRIPGLPPIGGMGTLTAPHSIESLHDPNQESRVIASLGFHQWYSLCRECFTRYRHTGISVQAEVKLGSIIFWPTSCQFQDATELAWVVGRELVLRRWRHDRLGVSRGHGPVRYTSGEVFGSIVRVSPWVFQANHTISWFSQANYIFTSLKIPSNYDDYTLINGVEFSLSIPFPEQNPPDGYLFLSSPMEFKTGPSSFRWPDCPAYWSLDPSGSNPLSAEEASILGFPRIELATEIGGVFWDDAVYAGLRKFHVAKGCDPDSQDVAHELGYPLYELSVPVAHLQKQISEWTTRTPAVIQAPIMSSQLFRMILWNPLKNFPVAITLLHGIIHSGDSSN